MALAVLVLTGLGLVPSAMTKETGPEQASRYVGNIAGLENIGARFVAIVAPDRRAVAFIGSRDGSLNQRYAIDMPGR